MKKDTLANVAVGLLAFCALIVTGLVVRRELFSQAPVAAAAQARLVADWRAYAGEGNAAGPVGAPVTFVVFSDYQCPACRMLDDTLRVLQSRHPNDVRVIRRHFPLASHAFAVPAAKASECAAAQGRFQQYHDALFAAQESIGNVPWTDFAKRAGVPDLSRFAACVNAPGEPAALARDRAMAQRLQVERTPTFLVNESRLEGARPLSRLEDYVQEAVRGSR